MGVTRVFMLGPLGALLNAVEASEIEQQNQQARISERLKSEKADKKSERERQTAYYQALSDRELGYDQQRFKFECQNSLEMGAAEFLNDLGKLHPELLLKLSYNDHFNILAQSNTADAFLKVIEKLPAERQEELLTSKNLLLKILKGRTDGKDLLDASPDSDFRKKMQPAYDRLLEMAKKYPASSQKEIFESLAAPVEVYDYKAYKFSPYSVFDSMSQSQRDGWADLFAEQPVSVKRGILGSIFADCMKKPFEDVPVNWRDDFEKNKRSWLKTNRAEHHFL